MRPLRDSWSSVFSAADETLTRRRARAILPGRPRRLAELPPPADRADLASVTVYVASYDTRTATELCVRSLRKHTPHPLSLVVGDSHSTDGSVEMLRAFEARGWLTVEVAAERRLHSEWLDRWKATCPTPAAVFVDSDVEILRSDWLELLVGAWRGTGAAVVCAEYLDDLRRFVEPVGREVVRAAPRPAPWLMLHDVEQTRAVEAGFAFDKERTPAFREVLVYDVGARLYQRAREVGLAAVQMPAAYGAYYRHYGGVSWRRTTPAEPDEIGARLGRLRAGDAD